MNQKKKRGLKINETTRKTATLKYKKREPEDYNRQEGEKMGT